MGVGVDVITRVLIRERQEIRKVVRNRTMEERRWDDIRSGSGAKECRQHLEAE